MDSGLNEAILSLASFPPPEGKMNDRSCLAQLLFPWVVTGGWVLRIKVSQQEPGNGQGWRTGAETTLPRRVQVRESPKRPYLTSARDPGVVF